MPAWGTVERTSALCSLVADGGVHERAARPGVVALVALLGEPGPRHGAQQPLVRLRLLEHPAARRGDTVQEGGNVGRSDSHWTTGNPVGGRGGVGSHL